MLEQMLRDYQDLSVIALIKIMGKKIVLTHQYSFLTG
jgi:hypothetical protein